MSTPMSDEEVVSLEPMKSDETVGALSRARASLGTEAGASPTQMHAVGRRGLPPDPPSSMMRDVELPQGYTLEEVTRLAKVAAGTTLTNPGDTMADRVDDAWSAIVERLYADPTPIEPGQLVWVGRKALYRADRATWHHYGVFKANDVGIRHGLGSMPAFRSYWWRPVTTVEGHVIDRMAFAQIWPKLSPAEQEAVVAVAIWGDQRVASEVLGKDVKYSLYNARKRFLALWHEGEEPSKHWGYDHPGPNRNGWNGNGKLPARKPA